MEINKTTSLISGSQQEDLTEAAGVLSRGGLVAFPTETVYGLGANALDPQAVAGIFKAKGRPTDNPLIIHVADTAQVYEISDEVTVQAQRVIEAFWPGPLTLVLPKRPGVPDEVTAGLNTVAIRMPDHPVALALIKMAGVPVAAPSANSSGRPSPTTARHVMKDLQGKIDLIVDGGPCRVGVESTVLDMTHEPPVILRPGAVSREALEGVLGHVEVTPALLNDEQAAAPKSPGVKYAHYAPEAEVIVVTGSDYQDIYHRANDLVIENRGLNRRVGVMASSETARGYMADEVFTMGSRMDLPTIAQNLFYAFRYLDEQGVDVIIAEGYPETGIGAAIMNRLQKAAGGRIISV